MPIVALTGGIASGKSAVCARLSQLDVPIIDTDHIAHQITGANGSAIIPIKQAFGDEYIDQKQALNRDKMRALVFEQPEARKKLEAITHPIIREHVKLMVAENQRNDKKNDYQVIAIPLLFESNHYAKLVDVTVTVDCTLEQQIARAMARSELTEVTIKSIIAAQVSREERLALADIVIENQHSLAELNVKIDALHVKLSAMCNKMSSRSAPSEVIAR